MCGIAGIIMNRAGADPALQDYDIRVMTGSLSHRGPDGEGFWNDPAGQVWFGHRRLAIIDTTAAAAQPMHYMDRFTIIYNGELYNFKELRQELAELGFLFLTNSDTEVILAAFSHFKEECLSKFDGMFAFAIWDNLDKRLFLARDRFGEKPLFFYENPDGRFLFASEMKALWATGAPRQMEEGQMLLYLATGTTGFPLEASRTIYKGIFQLPPASYAWLMPSREGFPGLAATRYWDIDTRQTIEPGEDEAARQLKELLEQSVKTRLRADVASGTSLSGGVDSGTIAAIASRYKGTGWNSFSAFFPGFEKDETTAVQELAGRLGIKNHGVFTSADDLNDCFDRLIYHQEQPIVSASVLVQFKVFERARQEGVAVLLDGQGADEVFGGYHHYIHWFLQEQWRAGQWRNQSRELHLFRQHGYEQDWGLRNYLAALYPQLAQSQLLNRQIRQLAAQPFVDRGFAEAHLPADDLFKPLVTSLNDILYFDLTMGKLPELLRYADRNSMAHGCEVRLPFLQHDLVRFVFSLPSTYKMRDGFTKWILRKTMGTELPGGNCWQTKKIAYEPPQAEWIRNPKIGERIMESRKVLVQKGILNKNVLSQPLQAGGANDQKNADWRFWVLASLT
ncbi:asparagine synthase (glutamine-hydrolyzing) [Flavihumibacter stibioxidans]|uniref:asparagine synthase (glutamine-hydrolyzing) n=1 Tax=Flavihumibacter stibioxidans TaxID=1834163 RepID=A0ABR7MCN6_9BACT|nr:asparagine synthase (glutamine-hydrolyzing) [Flavihumibacter stibioxidans]MBC6492731.1 asparagine synthase (glutamine-hydrolyzing) [Flavihumibacter stibioxidans]